MQQNRHFSTDPDQRLDFWTVVCWLAFFLAAGAILNIVAAARMAMG